MSRKIITEVRKLREGTRYRLISILSVVAFVLLWQFLLTPMFGTIFLPGPSTILRGASELLLQKKTLLNYCIVSLNRIMVGWIVGSAIGIIVGLLIGNFKVIKSMVDPFIHFLSFIPAIALLTAFMIWFGVGELSKIMLIIFATGFTVMINTATGVVAIEEEKIQAARSLGANRVQVFFYLTIPATIPYIYIGMRLAMRSSFLVIVAAEMLAASSGIGYLIWNSRLFFKIDWMYVGILTLGLLGFIVDRLWRKIGNTVLRRYVREVGRY
ncbi:MAG: ABC transporter permease [Candidatus Hadarchaeum sp.]|uniref:ABC transporter permease n=1 Tax=Candidatus Hadarchaeum sp. TaxID=2883567 RepID=UPI003175963C